MDSNDRLARLLTNPQLNGWGFVVGLVSLIFAFYVYWDAQSVPNLIAQVHPVRTILVSSEGIQSLSIYADGKPIKGPVTAAQIAIWNAGTKPIKAEDILEQIQIRTAKSTPLLSIRVIRTTRAVTKITVNNSKASSGVFGIGFQILEKGDGALLQVTYEGDAKLDFSGSGVIIGQNKFEITKPPYILPEPQKEYSNSLPSWLFIPSVILVLCLFGFRIAQALYQDLSKRFHEIKNGTKSLKSMIPIVLQTTFTIIILIYLSTVLAPVFQEVIKVNSPLFNEELG